MVETRIRSFDEGIELLSSALTALDGDLRPAQVADGLVKAMVGVDPEDDVALLVVRIDHPSTHI